MSNWSQVEENYEGIIVNCEYAEGKGWFLLRSSLHEPILCINIESDFSGGVEKILSSLGEFLRKYDEVDTSGL